VVASRRMSPSAAHLSARAQPVLALGDPRLRVSCDRVEDLKDPSFLAEIEALQDTLEAFRAQYGFGRAIAAPQIGVPKRFIALNLGAGPFVAVNPEITWRSTQTVSLWDDCMSFPSLMVKVERSKSISVRYTNPKGEDVHWERLALPHSELLQHEIDHLDGVLAVDRAVGPQELVSREAFEANRDEYSKLVDYVIQPTME